MKAKEITFGGIMVALSLITLYLTTILPMNTLAILTIVSCYIPICIIRSNLKTAFFVYIASTILSFLLLPINYTIMYGIFFGIYGIIKYFIEKLHKLPVEIILKLFVFNIILVVGFMLMTTVLGDLNMKLPIWALFLAAQIVFLIYDYAITAAISFYLGKFKKV